MNQTFLLDTYLLAKKCSISFSIIKQELLNAIIMIALILTPVPVRHFWISGDWMLFMNSLIFYIQFHFLSLFLILLEVFIFSSTVKLNTPNIETLVNGIYKHHFIWKEITERSAKF